MFIPENYTEDEVLEILQRISNQLSRAFHFGYYDLEDMTQEGILEGIKALPSYKSELSSLDTFLYNHIRNRFMNMKRNKLERKSPPCIQCVALHSECEYDDQTDCKKWRGWIERNNSKRILTESSIMDTYEGVNYEKHDIVESFAIREASNLLDKHMPIGLRADYLRLLDGIHIPRARRIKVYKIASEILQQVQGDFIEEVVSP